MQTAIDWLIDQYKKDDGNNMWYGYDAIISRYTPIELPSDEEIANKAGILFTLDEQESFIDGAKWMKEQILNQNK